MEILNNLIAIFAIFIWSYFGYIVTSLFVTKITSTMLCVAIGIPFGMITFSWIVFILNVKFPLDSLLGWSVTIILGFIGFFLSNFIPKVKKTTKNLLFSLVIPIILPTLYICAFMKYSFLNHGIETCGAIYGDFPFHLNIISSFVCGCNSKRKSLFDIKSPFFANVKLAYPVIVNFLSAVLISCFNVGIQESLLFPSLPIAFSIIALLYTIVFDFTKNKYAALISPWMFLFLGGRGFLNCFDKEAAGDRGADYVHFWGAETYSYWLQTLIHVLLPQRSSLFGLALTYSFLVVMGRANFKSPIAYVFCGLLVALMPQVQMHACISVFEWTLAYAVVNFPWLKRKRWWKQLKCYFSLAITAFTLSIPQMIPFLGRAHSKGFFSFKHIWGEEGIGVSYADLWWNGLFLFWLIAIYIGLYFLSIKQIKEYVPALFVFFVSNFIHYQPWNIDNTKVFYGAWIPYAVAVVANFYVFVLSKNNKIIEPIAYMLFFCTFFSGFLSHIYLGTDSYPQWDKEDDPFAFAEKVIHNTEPDSVWLTDSFHNHPVSTLAGRQILVGFNGWLYSHNINGDERYREIEKLCADPDNTTWMDANNVNYICYHTTEHEGVSVDFSGTQKWELLFEHATWKVFKRNGIE